MNHAVVLKRLQQFLFLLSGGLFACTLLELWLVEHAENFVQIIPHVLCVFGVAAVVGVLLRPSRALVWGLRLLMSLACAGALYGIYNHVTGNIAFENEVNPNATSVEMLMGALGGANPLLAPGVLAIAAVLGLAATYYHPALETRNDARGTMN